MGNHQKQHCVIYAPFRFSYLHLRTVILFFRNEKKPLKKRLFFFVCRKAGAVSEKTQPRRAYAHFSANESFQMPFSKLHDARNFASSSFSSSSVSTSRTPSRPRMHGTPANTPCTPYSPSSRTETVKMLFSPPKIALTMRTSASPMP